MGSLLRSPHQPFAHLVDAAAEKWLAVEHASDAEQQRVNAEITGAFRIGDRPELTFHGNRFLLTIERNAGGGCAVSVHTIALNG